MAGALSAALIALAVLLSASGLWFLLEEARAATQPRGPSAAAIPALRAAGPKQVGSPSASEIPVGLTINKIGLEVRVDPVGLAADGALVVPDPSTTGWYEAGVRPGEQGHSVIAGHVDSRQGPAVFYRLHELNPGDEVLVRGASGSTLTFVVEGLESQPKEVLPASRAWRASDQPMLVLITCGGKFDKRSRSYADNLLVYAALKP